LHTMFERQSPRFALTHLLDNLSQRRIIYMHAPAGFGKTVSTLLWLEHRQTISPIKWELISLDVYDDNATEFCRRFITALVNLHPDNKDFTRIVANPLRKTAPMEFTLHVISLLGKTNDPYIIVLDDLHVIGNEDILTFIPIMLKRLPENYSILLLSRAEPPRSFYDIVAKGDLPIVSSEHLKFNENEIKTLFELNGKHITNKQAKDILISTGGWVIGIRAFLLARGEAYTTRLNDRYLKSFLQTHVWERWTTEYKEFMKAVSVVEEMTPSLCDYLTSNKHSETMLDALMQENAFLRVVGKDTYKFHDLFRAFLLDLLPQSERGAHYNGAARYYYKQRDYYRSVQYFLKGENDDGVADSIYNMYNYNSSYASVEDTLHIVRLSLSERVIKKHPFLLEAEAWCAYVDGRPAECEQYLDKYYKLLPKIILKSPRSAITSIFVRCMDYRNDFIKMVTSLRMAPFKADVRAYTPSLTQSLPYFHRAGRDFSEIFLDIDNKFTIIEKSLGSFLGADFSIIKACAYAGFHYECGNIHEAHEYALIACASISVGASSEMKFCAMMLLAASLNASGQPVTEAISNIDAMIKKDNAFYLTANFRAFKIRLLLANGNKDAANEWLSEQIDGPNSHLSFYKSYRHFTTARAYITKGEYNNAVMMLKKLLALAESYNRPLDIIEARILLAIANWKKGRGGINIALDCLNEAIHVAYKYKYRQLFTNDGAELTAMLHRLQKRAYQSPAHMPAEFVKTLYIAATYGAKQNQGLTGNTMPKKMNFTDKQKTVMRLMCEGHSRATIAQIMGLKPNGVKSHTTLIYNKLSVSNNMEAVLKIKELGL